MSTKSLLTLVFLCTFQQLYTQTEKWAAPFAYSTGAVDTQGHFVGVIGSKLVRHDSATGAIIWSQDYGAPIQALAIARDGSMYIAGDFSTDIAVGGVPIRAATSFNLYVARLASSGAVIWIKQISGGTGFNRIQLATDSRNSVYAGGRSADTSLFVDGTNVTGLSYPNLFAVKFLSDGSYRFVNSVNYALHAYVGDQTTYSFSTDRQDNLHFCFYTNGATLRSGPPDNKNYPLSMGDCRVWYDSTGHLLGGENLTTTVRQWMTGYRAGTSGTNYALTKIQKGLDGMDLTWAGIVDIGTPCYNKPPVAPDVDRFGRFYYAGNYPVYYEPPPCFVPGGNFLGFGTDIRGNTGRDIYANFYGTFFTTQDNGYTNESVSAVIADPNGRSVYFLGGWSKLADTSRFYFANQVFDTPSNFVLRYGIGRPEVGPLSINPGDVSVCAGGSAIIGAAATGGVAPYAYEWTPSATLNDPLVTTPVARPATTTDYTVKVTDAIGTTITKTVRVTVDSSLYVPTITLNSGTNPFCEGQTVQLISSPASSFLWSTGSNFYFTQLTHTDTVTVTAVRNDGCVGTSLPYIATMKPRTSTPTVSPAAPAFCLGDSVVLTASVTEIPVTYSWSNGATSAATTISAAATYSVTATGANGCTSKPATVTSTSYPIPTGSITPGGTISICAGDSLHLTINSFATGFLWNTGAITQTVWVKEAGAFSAQLRSAQGCVGTTSNTVTTTITPIPNPSIAQSGNVLTVQPAEDSYQWFFNGTAIAGATSQSYTITQGGNYSVQVIKTGCKAFASLTAVLRIAGQNVSYQLYPNPSLGEANLVYTLTEPQRVSILISDVAGQKIINVLNEVQTAGEHQIKLNDGGIQLPKGFYFITLKIGARSVVGKLIIP